MDLHAQIWLRVASVPCVDQSVFKLVTVSLRTLALDTAVRLDVGQRRAVGLGHVSSRSLGLVQRRLVLDALRILPISTKLVASGVGRRRDLWRERVLVSVAV